MEFLTRCVGKVAFALLIACVSGCARAPEPGLAAGAIGPDFVSKTLDGKEVRLSDFRGKVVVLTVWAAWCGTCLSEMPEFEKIYQSLKERGLVVLAAGVDDTPDNFIEVRDRLALSFPITVDSTASVKQLYKVWGYPETFVLDREGRIQMLSDNDGKTSTVRFVGPREWSNTFFVKQLEALLAR